MQKKYYWIGQRMIDGVIYSQSIPGLSVIFCCDSCFLPEKIEKKFEIYSLERKSQKKLNWSSFHIDLLFQQFSKEISFYESKGYIILPYDIPSFLLHIKKRDFIINWRVISYNIPRAIQRMILLKSDIKVPKWLSIDSQYRWEDMSTTLGSHIIIQYDNTSSGHGTFLIKSKEQFEFLKNNVGNNPAIASSFIPDSIPISSHLLIDNNFIQDTIISFQIIETIKKDGIISLIYYGNDFGIYNYLNSKQKENIKKTLNLLGQILFKTGIRGLLGIDMLVTSNNDVYVIEINFRLQNSTPLSTQIETNLGMKPLILKLINSKNTQKYSKKNIKKTQMGAQYILRSKENKKTIRSGIYDTNGNLLHNIRNFDITTLSDKQYMVVSESWKNTTFIAKGAPLAKIYSFEPILTITGNRTKKFSYFLEKLGWP